MPRATQIVTLAAIVALTLAATTPQSPVQKAIQTQRLEVVNDAGQVLFVARATAYGGRLEVNTRRGETLFSIGIDPDDPERPSVWERTRRQVNNHGRDLTRQRRTMETLTRQLQQVERQLQQLQRQLRPTLDLDRQRHDVEQQRRELDALARQVSQLSRQVQTLERR
jgi:chromosome segregation ATPase